MVETGVAFTVPVFVVACPIIYLICWPRSWPPMTAAVGGPLALFAGFLFEREAMLDAGRGLVAVGFVRTLAVLV